MTAGFVVRSFTVGDTTTSCSCASVGYIGLLSLCGSAVSLDACVILHCVLYLQPGSTTQQCHHT